MMEWRRHSACGPRELGVGPQRAVKEDDHELDIIHPARVREAR